MTHYALSVEWDGFGRTTTHNSLNEAMQELATIGDWVSFRISTGEEGEILIAHGHCFGLRS